MKTGRSPLQHLLALVCAMSLSGQSVAIDYRGPDTPRGPEGGRLNQVGERGGGDGMPLQRGVPVQPVFLNNSVAQAGTGALEGQTLVPLPANKAENSGGNLPRGNGATTEARVSVNGGEPVDAKVIRIDSPSGQAKYFVAIPSDALPSRTEAKISVTQETGRGQIVIAKGNLSEGNGGQIGSVVATAGPGGTTRIPVSDRALREGKVEVGGAGRGEPTQVTVTIGKQSVPGQLVSSDKGTFIAVPSAQIKPGTTGDFVVTQKNSNNSPREILSGTLRAPAQLNGNAVARADAGGTTGVTLPLAMQSRFSAGDTVNLSVKPAGAGAATTVSVPLVERRGMLVAQIPNTVLAPGDRGTITVSQPQAGTNVQVGVITLNAPTRTAASAQVPAAPVRMSPVDAQIAIASLPPAIQADIAKLPESTQGPVAAAVSAAPEGGFRSATTSKENFVNRLTQYPAAAQVIASLPPTERTAAVTTLMKAGGVEAIANPDLAAGRTMLSTIMSAPPTERRGGIEALAGRPSAVSAIASLPNASDRTAALRVMGQEHVASAVDQAPPGNRAQILAVLTQLPADVVSPAADIMTSDAGRAFVLSEPKLADAVSNARLISNPAVADAILDAKPADRPAVASAMRAIPAEQRADAARVITHVPSSQRANALAAIRTAPATFWTKPLADQRLDVNRMLAAR